MPTIEEILQSRLTDKQRNAAQDLRQEILSLACAGSGKSTTMAYRIARLIVGGAEPKAIVAFTFTEKAAESMKRRAAKAIRDCGLPDSILGTIYIGTIHSYCNAILCEIDARYRQYEVLDENRLKLYLISRFYSLGLPAMMPRANNRYFQVINEISNAWKTCNDEMVRLEDVELEDAELGRVLIGLRTRLDEDEYIDFSLMIRLVVERLAERDPNAERAVATLMHLMVDEYQDVNTAQERLVQELRRRCQTLFVVGDDDQAIYSWRGADVNNILTFRDRYASCSEHTLSENFRSTQAIVEVADRFAAAELGASRIVKSPTAFRTRTPRDLRVLWFDTRAQEAEWVASRIADLLGTEYEEADGTRRGLTPGDFAILMRSTREPESTDAPRHQAFSAALTARNILYSLEAGGGVFEIAQVDVLRESFELLRPGSPDRNIALDLFNRRIRGLFPAANFDKFARALTQWGRLIHTPAGGARRRVFPQRLVFDLLEAFGLQNTVFDERIMRGLGLFSRMIQDVEAVYLSIDSASRFREILNFLRNVAESGYDISTDDVLTRPDLVTISTVHKAKGLEFPVVFIVDVEAQRFPKNNRAYAGWLPQRLIQPALNRGAYQSTSDEEARLFYTALTRAERYLYISGSARLPGGVRARQRSRFMQRLSHQELLTDPAGMPTGLVRRQGVPRVDETMMPTSFSEIRYYLSCPRDYQFRKNFGFSPAIPEMFGFGKTVHTAVGKLHEVYPDRRPSGDEAEEVARDVFHLKHVPPSRNPASPGPYENALNKAAEIVRDYVDTFGDDFTRNRQVEARFEVPVEQAVISGSIDLILKEDETGQVLDATVVDFKAMEGGENPEDNRDLQWTELSLQVQLYANAAREVLGENARTGAVHLLKDNQRVEVSVTDEAIQSAVANVEWAVERILDRDFPRRPHPAKCPDCDYKQLCSGTPEAFRTSDVPPPIHIPGPAGRTQMARAFSEFNA